MSGNAAVLVVGGGKMGEAILSGWIASDSPAARAIVASDVVVVEPNGERRAHLERAWGVGCVADIARAPRADLVVLAVKPQVMRSVLGEAAACGAFGAPRESLFVSIAAGLATSTLEELLPEGAPLVRVMPNMPLMVAAGASGVCAGRHASPEQLERVRGLFDCLGTAVVVDEPDMDVVCALSGSGPAYVAAFIEALRDAAQAQGLDPKLAEALALQTVLGTARLIDSTELSVGQAREAVCSPGGTTLAALAAFEQANFNQAIAAGLDAAVARSKELSQC